MIPSNNKITNSRYINRNGFHFLTSHIFEQGNVIVGVSSGDFTADIHITREEAMTLSRNLEEIVAAYDATVDRYHEVCDEPATAEVP